MNTIIDEATQDLEIFIDLNYRALFQKDYTI